MSRSQRTFDLPEVILVVPHHLVEFVLQRPGARFAMHERDVLALLVVNGRMDGVWRHERKGKRLIVTIQPFTKIPKWAKSMAEAEAERLANFLGGSLDLTWKPT